MNSSRRQTANRYWALWLLGGGVLIVALFGAWGKFRQAERSLQQRSTRWSERIVLEGKPVAGPVAAAGQAPLPRAETLLPRLKQDIAYLASLREGGPPSRMAGMAGCEVAADYLAERFRQAGLENVSFQEFEVVVPITKKMSFRVGLPGKEWLRIEAYPVWPNWCRTGTTAHRHPAGRLETALSGPLIDGGEGFLADFEGKNLAGAVVVLTDDVGFNWMTAAALGAQAMVFVGSEKMTRLEAEAKYSEVPLDVPRFYVPPAEGEKLRRLIAEPGPVRPQARLECRVDWEAKTCRNVLGFLQGTDRSDDKLNLVTAYYDAASVVPDVAPGAEAACSIAGLLAVVEHLGRNRPKKSLAFAALGAHFQSLSGAKRLADLLRTPHAALLNQIEEHKNKLLGEEARRGLTFAGAVWLVVKHLFGAVLLFAVARLIWRRFAPRGGPPGTESSPAGPGGRKSTSVALNATLFAGALLLAGGFFAGWGFLTRPAPVGKGELATARYQKVANAVQALPEEPEAVRAAIIAPLRRLDEAAQKADHYLQLLKNEAPAPEVRSRRAADFAHALRRAADTGLCYVECQQALDQVKNADRRLGLKRALETLHKRDRARFAERADLHRLLANLVTLERIDPSLPVRMHNVISLDLSSHSDSLGTYFKGNFLDQMEGNLDKIPQQAVSRIGYLAVRLARNITEKLGRQGEPVFLDGINKSELRNWQEFLPDFVALDNEPFHLAAIPAMGLVSTGDNRKWIDTPLDTPQRVDYLRLARQVELLVPLLWELHTDDEALAAYRQSAGLARGRFCRLVGEVVRLERATGFGLAGAPMPNVLVGCYHYAHPYWNRHKVRKNFLGVRAIEWKYADFDGIAWFDSVSHTEARWWENKEYKLVAYGLEAQTGRITHAPDDGQDGERKNPTRLRPKKAREEMRVVLFECDPLMVVDLVNVRDYCWYEGIDVYDAATGAEPLSWGMRWLEKTGYQAGDRTYVDPAVVVFARPRSRLKLRFGAYGKGGTRYPLLGSESATRGQYEGDGYLVDGPTRLPHPASYLMARDLYHLNDYRLKVLHRHGIRIRSVENLHQAAGEALQQSERARETARNETCLRQARRAWALEARAYPDLRGTIIDIVIGVVFYLFLLLPFSYFAERLFFGFPDLKRQILSFFAIFLGVFLVLALVHPAFGITNAAPVILLAFVMISLSLLVITMIWSRFGNEVRKLQGRPGASGRADVSRAGALKSAVLLGIYNLRRRAMRTMLTLVTLIILMFSMLSLASVESRLELRHWPIVVGGRLAGGASEADFEPAYQGLLIRHSNWSAPVPRAYEDARRTFPAEDGYLVTARAWLARGDVEQAATYVVTNSRDPARFARAEGLVGFMPPETYITIKEKEYLVRGRWFKEGEENAIILPLKIARACGVSPEEVGVTGAAPTVELFGETMTIIGLFDGARLQRLKDLDTQPLSPVDPRKESWQRAWGRQESEETFYHHQHYEMENVAFVPYSFCMRNGGEMKSIAVLPPPREGGLEAAVRLVKNDFLKRVTIPVFAARGADVTLLTPKTAQPISGFWTLLVPLVIGSLIVLNTMLASVYERTREIFIYGSLGLAPRHIGALFVAEAVVYAVMSSVIGYVLGQVVAGLLTARGLLGGLELNYSSTSAILSALVVMVVVIGSTAYPARRAVQLSCPDVARIWKFPQPLGDLLIFDFPFTVSEKQAPGIMRFIQQWFDDHANQAIGDFMALDTRLAPRRPEDFGEFCAAAAGSAPLPEAGPPGGAKLAARVWIAPFDFAISQDLLLETIPSADAGVLTTRMTLKRLSGAPAGWARMNHRFLKLLRKQFLLWRILSAEERDSCLAEACAVLGLPFRLTSAREGAGRERVGGAQSAGAPAEG